MDDDDDFEGIGGGPPVQLQFTNLQPKEWQSLQKVKKIHFIILTHLMIIRN
jgi:hypothetical protein